MPVYKDQKRGTYYVRISTTDAVKGQRSVFRFAADFYGMDNPSSGLKKLRAASRTASCEVWTVEEFRQFLEYVPGEEYRRLFDFMFLRSH